MNNFLFALSQVNFLGLVWLFFLVFVLHELEEWNIDQFEHKNFVGVPPAATDRSVRMWIGFVVGVGLLWSAAAVWPGSPAFAAWVFLPAVAIMVQNAFQHVWWSLYFKQVAPGLVTAALLLIPLGSYMGIHAVQQGLTPFWYAALCALWVAAGVVQTVRAGNRMTPLIRAINQLGITLSERIR